MATTIVTLALDPQNQQRFDDLRTAYYPPHLNRIAAHLTLFHALPGSEGTRDTLALAASRHAPFEMRVSGVMNLGRGTAYRVESAELLRIHADLSEAFAQDLISQDRQRFRPHIVVQNKVSGEQAKLLQAQMTAEFREWGVVAEGLDWWDYLGGPWELRERFRFDAA